MGRLQDKVAIITGGSRGMGRGYCQRFGAEGARVAVTERQHEPNVLIESVQARLRQPVEPAVGREVAAPSSQSPPGYKGRRLR